MSKSTLDSTMSRASSTSLDSEDKKSSGNTAPSSIGSCFSAGIGRSEQNRASLDYIDGIDGFKNTCNTHSASDSGDPKNKACALKFTKQDIPKRSVLSLNRQNSALLAQLSTNSSNQANAGQDENVSNTNKKAIVANSSIPSFQPGFPTAQHNHPSWTLTQTAAHSGTKNIYVCSNKSTNTNNTETDNNTTTKGKMNNNIINSINTSSTKNSNASSQPAAERVLPSLCVKTVPKLAMNIANGPHSNPVSRSSSPTPSEDHASHANLRNMLSFNNSSSDKLTMNMPAADGIRPTKKPIYTPSVLRRTMTTDRLNTIASSLATKSANDQDVADYYNYCNAAISSSSQPETPLKSSLSHSFSTSNLSTTNNNTAFTGTTDTSSSSSSSFSFLDQPSKAHWSANNSRSTCTNCSAPFSVFSTGKHRRHHCRRCGQLFCDPCSSYTVRLDPNCNFHLLGQKTRACGKCFAEFERFVEKVDGFVEKVEGVSDVNALADMLAINGRMTANGGNSSSNKPDESSASSMSSRTGSMNSSIVASPVRFSDTKDIKNGEAVEHKQLEPERVTENAVNGENLGRVTGWNAGLSTNAPPATSFPPNWNWSTF